MDIHKMQLPHTFDFPPSWRHGIGLVREVGKMVKELGCSKPLILTDNLLLSKGIVQPVMTALDNENIPYTINDDINQEPTVNMFNALIASLDLRSFDSIIAVGGGSILDVSKGVAVIASFGGQIRDYDGFNKVPGRPHIKIIAVPTTSGTGSEISDGIVLIDEERETKFLVISKKICPDVALTDPEMTYSMPPRVTACSGVDALVHATESYISKNASPVTELFSLKAIESISSSLKTVYENGSDAVARSKMQMGATMAMTAGMNSYLGLCHAMAMPLCALYHMPHGEACGMALPVVLRFNSKVAGNKIKTIFDTMDFIETDALKDPYRQLRIWLSSIGITDGLKQFGYKPDHMETIVKETLNSAQRATNPRNPDEQDIVEIVNELL